MSGLLEYCKKGLYRLNELNKKYDILNILIISTVIILISYFAATHFYCVLSDRGREFLIPQEILNGKVPYKDITLIYFPLGYYINAIIYKILGVSINSLHISQTFLCMIFIGFYYYCARLFTDKTGAFLLSLLAIVCGIFSTEDLFCYMFPYAYAQTYGIFCFFICIFCLIKLFKTDNIKYLYAASFFTGFCAACKLEFLSVFILLIFGLCIYKKLKLSQYFKTFILTLIVPFATFATLIAQGVRMNDLVSAIKFGYHFSKTASMNKFLTSVGMYPDIDAIIGSFAGNFSDLILILVLCFIFLKLSNKYSKLFLLPIPIMYWYSYYDNFGSMYFWSILPLLVLIFTLVKFKDLLNNDRSLLILLIGSLFLSQRIFFVLLLTVYGPFSLLFLTLSLYILLVKYGPREIYNVSLKNILNYTLIIVIGIYSLNYYYKVNTTNFKISSDLGTIYVDQDYYEPLKSTLDYVDKKVGKDETVLLLPEGNIINFLSQRKVDMKCFMMDRLYHDGYGEEKARDMVANTNSDYIIIFEGFDLFDFYAPYLYQEDQTVLFKYIKSHYKAVRNLHYDYGDITIYKKML